MHEQTTPLSSITTEKAIFLYKEAALRNQSNVYNRSFHQKAVGPTFITTALLQQLIQGFLIVVNSHSRRTQV